MGSPGCGSPCCCGWSPAWRRWACASPGRGGGSRGHRLEAPLAHPALGLADHGLQGGHAREALGVARDEVPWRALDVGARQHVVDRADILGPAAAVAPVLVGDLPHLQRVLLASAEAPQLLRLGDVQEELDEDHPVGGEHALEVLDLVVRAAPLLLGRVALYALDEHAAVPGAVEDRQAAPARQRRPEPPQVVVALLVVRRRAVGGDPEVARVEVGDQAADRPALARGVPPLEDHAQRRAEAPVARLAPELQAQLLEAELPRRQARGLVVARELQAEVDVVQAAHRRILDFRPSWPSTAPSIPSSRSRRWRRRCWRAGASAMSSASRCAAATGARSTCSTRDRRRPTAGRAPTTSSPASSRTSFRASRRCAGSTSSARAAGTATACPWRSRSSASSGSPPRRTSRSTGSPSSTPAAGRRCSSSWRTGTR